MTKIMQKHGVCQYLMDLEDEWENSNFGVEYESFFNLGIVPTIGSGRFMGLPIVISEEESKAGIIMTSVLFCRHGGFIYPVTSGQGYNAVESVSGQEKLYALACTVYGDNKGGLLEEQQKANAEYIYNFLKKQGWTTEAICGVLGNMQKESGMNPGVWQYWEDPEYGFGLVQWSESREFLEFAHLETIEASELAESDPHKMMDIQLDYLLKSFYGVEANEEGDVKHVGRRWLSGNALKYYDKLPLSEGVPKEMTVEEFSKAEYDCKDLALVFHATYERSGDNKDQLQMRADYAEKWYLYFTEGEWE